MSKKKKEILSFEAWCKKNFPDAEKYGINKNVLRIHYEDYVGGKK